MIRRRRTRTAKVRTALSCPCPAGQTDTGQSFFRKSGQNPDTGQNRDRQNPDRQTSDRIFYKIPDRIRTADRIETNRIRTGRHLTVNPDRIRTADRQTPDKNEIDNDVLTDNKLLILNVNRILRFVWTWTCHQESKIGPFEVISLPNPFSKSSIVIPNLPISIIFNGF